MADLGRLVKQKYPGPYDHLDDQQVGVLVQQKYPGAYDQFGDLPAQTDDPESGWSHFFKNLNPVPAVKAAWDELKAHPVDALSNPAEAVVRPLMGNLIQAHSDQLKKAKTAYEQGNYMEAAGHLGAAALPAVGPAAANAAEVIGGTQPKFDKYGNIVKSGQKPNPVGGTLEAAGLVAPIVAGGAAARALRGKTPPPPPPAPDVATSQMALPSIAPDASAQLPEQAAASTAGKLQGRMEGMPWGSIDDLRTAAASGDTHAQQVADQIDYAGNNPHRILQASLNLNDWRTAQQAEDLYSKVEDLADNKYQLGEVPLTQTRSILTRSLGVAEGAKLKDPGLIRTLREIKQNITPPEGETFANNTYGRIRELVSDLGEKIRMQQTGDNAIIGPKGIGQLQAVKSALENDLSDFTETSGVPELQQAARAADDYYRQVRVPYKDAGLARAATTDEPDTIFQNFVKAGRGDRAQKFYDALEPKGQAALQYQMLAKAIADSTDPVKGFDAAKFARDTSRLGDAYGVAFDGASREAIQGLQNLVTHAAKVEMNPAAHMLPGKVGAAGSIAPVVSPVLSRWAKVLMTTDQGRAYLYRASKLPPGSPSMQQLWNSLKPMLPRLAQGAAAAGAGIQAGDTVLYNGQAHIVRSINPDGTAEIDPVQK